MNDPVDDPGTVRGTSLRGLDRVREALAAAGYRCEVVELADSTRTAKEAAAAIGCEVAQIVKSLVFRTRAGARPVMVLASGVNRVDESLLAKLVGEPVEKADADFVRNRTGFAIGGVPPLGHREPVEVLIDRDLYRHPQLWAAAGTPHAVFRLEPKQLESMTGGRVADVCAATCRS